MIVNARSSLMSRPGGKDDRVVVQHFVRTDSDGLASYAQIVQPVADRWVLWPQDQGLSSGVNPLTQTEAFRSAKHLTELEAAGRDVAGLEVALRVAFRKSGLEPVFDEALATCRGGVAPLRAEGRNVGQAARGDARPKPEPPAGTGVGDESPAAPAGGTMESEEVRYVGAG